MSEMEFTPVPSCVQDLTGMRFSKLVAVGYAGTKNRPDAKRNRRRHYWWCRCDCGSLSLKDADVLKGNKTCSCGCVKKARLAKLNLSHGLFVGRQKMTAEYKAWSNIKTRCMNPKNKAWHNYGGRGITLHPEWGADFMAFLREIGPRPSARYSVERIDNEKGYEPGNVRWATQKEQTRNTRHNVIIEYQGESLTLVDWAERLGLNYFTLHFRVRRRGQPFEQAVAEMQVRGPKQKRKPAQPAN